MTAPRYLPPDRVPRTLALLAAAGSVAFLWRQDPVAAGIALAGWVAVALFVTRRAPGAGRRSALALVAGATTAALVSAVVLSMPLEPVTPKGPLVVTAPDVASSANALDPAIPAATVLGFVTPDYGDSAAVLDQDGPRLSTVAATGLSLGPEPGSIAVLPAAETLARAHDHGATALAVVSNYDGTAFNGDRAARMLQSSSARRRTAKAIVAEVTRRGWDGIVIDLERLPASARNDYPQLVRAVADAAGKRPVVVAVPAFDPSTANDYRGYDLAALGAAADQVVWMAYDQHQLTSAPGPIAGLPWVRAGLAVATDAIPREKLLLGVAGYGYAWSNSGTARELTAPEGQALAAAPGSSPEWDEAEQEWRVRTADGEAWYADARSTAVRAGLAAEEHLAGIALWRVGAEDPAALSGLPFPTRRFAGALPGQAAEVVRARGVVALTFDDGPDPRWTPQILDILRRRHVPATFFVIAGQAQAHPKLLRRAVAEGHVIANHTYSHRDLTAMSEARAKAEILGGSAVIEGIIGRKPMLFRAPYGAGDSQAGDGAGDALALDLGLHPVHWTDDSADWRRPGSAVIAERILTGASARTIVLLHDGGGDRSQTVEALPAILDGLLAQGYAFTTVDRLAADVTAPYAPRRDTLSQARGLGVITAFRLQLAARRVLVALLVLIAGLSLVRIVVGVPLALFQRRLVRRRRRRPFPEGLTFTVIVPACNEERVIAKTLGALDLAMRPGVDVIVVDDGSTDSTAEVADAFDVKVIRQPQGGKAAALNTGIAAAHGDVIVVLDADTVLHGDFFDAVGRHFADPSVGAVAGNVKVGNRRSLLARLQALEYVVSLNIDRRAQDVLGVIAVVPGAAGAFRRAALVDVGGYPGDTLVEDADLTLELLRGGWKIVYEPGAVSYTEAPEGLRDVLRQRRRWAYGSVELLAKHSRSMLRPDQGRVGLLWLPWALLSQVVLPVAGPLADAFLVYLVLCGDLGLAGALLAVALLLDIVVAGAVVVAEREDPRLLVAAPLLRLVWRPLQIFTVVGSLARWANGGNVVWRRVRRHNSVALPEAPEAAPAPASFS